jgi:hypothetical protein
MRVARTSAVERTKLTGGLASSDSRCGANGSDRQAVRERSRRRERRCMEGR